jgi:hypothetical protein
MLKSFAVGDDLKWDAPWVTVRLWVELPFWLIVNDTNVAIEHEGHVFPVTIHDGYFELFIAEATDSRKTVVYRGPLKKREDFVRRLEGNNGRTPRDSSHVAKEQDLLESGKQVQRGRLERRG